MLTGYTARPDFLKKVTWIAVKHDDRIRCIERVIAFHFGSRYLVEVHIVLPAEMSMKEAHDLSNGLQMKIERLSEVERAFVHTNYECEWLDRDPKTRDWQEAGDDEYETRIRETDIMETDPDNNNDETRKINTKEEDVV